MFLVIKPALEHKPGTSPSGQISTGVLQEGNGHFQLWMPRKPLCTEVLGGTSQMLPPPGSSEVLCWTRAAFGSAQKGSTVFVGICAGFDTSGAGAKIPPLNDDKKIYNTF